MRQLKDRGIETVLADDYAQLVAKPYADKLCRASTPDKRSQRDNLSFSVAATARKKMAKFHDLIEGERIWMHL